MSEPLWVLVAAVLGCVVLYALSRQARKRPPVTAESLRRELDRLTHDPRASASLLERERARSPERSELELLRVVVRRLERERRR
jgi:hypothetical protein